MVNFLNGQGKTKITFLSNLVNLCIGIPLSLILIPRFGVIGLLITIIVAPKPSLLLKLWWIKKNFGFSINWVSSVKIYLSSFIAFLVASYVLTSTGFNDWVDLFVGGGIFLLTYSLLVPLVGALEEIDIQNLRNIVGALGPLAPLFNVFLFLIEKVTRKTNHASTPEGELE
jgi:O-antigen/teichoic acid export membrane protein